MLLRYNNIDGVTVYHLPGIKPTFKVAEGIQNS